MASSIISFALAARGNRPALYLGEPCCPFLAAALANSKIRPPHEANKQKTDMLHKK